MAGRTWAGLAGIAAGTSVTALVLAQVISQPVAASALFVVFLGGLFALLAVAVVASDQWVQGIWASPEKWPRWVERRRLIRFVLRQVRFVLHQMRRALSAVAVRIRRVAAEVRKELTREALGRHARTALDALGLPLDEPEMTPDATGALEHAVSTPRAVARHQRVDGDEHRRTYLPAEYRVTRDALEKACQGAKERSVPLHRPPLPQPDDPSAPVRISSTVRMVSHHPKPDRGELQRAFAAKKARAAREALKNAGHTALVAAMGILPDRTDSAPTR